MKGPWDHGQIASKHRVLPFLEHQIAHLVILLLILDQSTNIVSNAWRLLGLFTPFSCIFFPLPHCHPFFFSQFSVLFHPFLSHFSPFSLFLPWASIMGQNPTPHGGGIDLRHLCCLQTSHYQVLFFQEVFSTWLTWKRQKVHQSYCYHFLFKKNDNKTLEEIMQILLNNKFADPEPNSLSVNANSVPMNYFTP